MDADWQCGCVSLHLKFYRTIKLEWTLLQPLPTWGAVCSGSRWRADLTLNVSGDEACGLEHRGCWHCPPTHSDGWEHYPCNSNNQRCDCRRDCDGSIEDIGWTDRAVQNGTCTYLCVCVRSGLYLHLHTVAAMLYGMCRNFAVHNVYIFR